MRKKETEMELAVAAPGLPAARRVETIRSTAGHDPTDEELLTRVAARAAEVLEVDLVVLDPADRERELGLQRPHLRVDLVRRAQVDLAELAEDLVPFRDVALVELVVRLDRLAGDAVQLVQGRLQLPRHDLRMVVGERHAGLLSISSARRTNRRRHHAA